MKSAMIRLSLVENVNNFVNIVARYKSILGIFSLDLSKPITLEIYSDDCSDLLEEISPFLIKEE